jgi:hypothetical protein
MPRLKGGKIMPGTEKYAETEKMAPGTEKITPRTEELT